MQFKYQVSLVPDAPSLAMWKEPEAGVLANVRLSEAAWVPSVTDRETLV